jgi:pimeloyl-ACP methyl ester carboxylesterase
MSASSFPIECFDARLLHGITLSCRACGPGDAPRLVFLHGFPEGAFVWDELMRHFGGRYRCVAPNLRGYERSSAPAEVAAYRPKELMADIEALIVHLGGSIEALVAHDWGGALAWNFAVRHAPRLKHLVIINAPHPATFLRELQHNLEQQAASAYMNFLRRPDAQALLVENDYARLWLSFTNMGAADPQHPGGGWLTDDAKAKYRDVWRSGLEGALNYYRASPLHPPTPDDPAVMSLQFPPETVTVPVPTLVIWAEADAALRVGLLDGLDAFVPRMRVVRVPGATHWIVHERPELVAREIEHELQLPDDRLRRA